MATSSFGGTIKLTGASEYMTAVKNINSNLKTLSSEIKLTGTEFNSFGNKIGDLRNKNDALNKKLEEEKKLIHVCSNAVKNFTSQQTKNKEEIDKLKTALENEKSSLEKLKNSTTATSGTIAKQEQIIKKLEQELIKSQSSYESNNRKINDYTIKMNNAKSECAVLTKEIQNNNSILDKTKNNFKDNAKSVKDFATEEEKAGSTTLSLSDLIKGNLISEGIITGIKGLAGAMKKVGSAFLDIGKSAIESYADYEQLVGGVETLFKKSAGIVEKNANNAYKTAGLSANQYMETVTSFSASLLQSLNGNTKKSAKVADMAIKDMSDNANKMGTDMSMIQNAYQGFAKQNYTMLDNLKLGYGGTKSEMERLLSDATKLSKTKYNIDSLNDVYQAIHVIQGKLDITGTTAKEADTTISGSLNSMKSAWQNMLTGISDEKADFGGLINNLVNSIMTVSNNLVPRIETTINGIGKLITDGLPKLLPKILPVATNTLTNLMKSVSSMLPKVIKTLSDQLPTILDTLLDGAMQLISSLASKLPTIIPQLITSIIGAMQKINEHFDELLKIGLQVIVGIVKGIIASLPEIAKNIPTIIKFIINLFAFSKFLKLGKNVIKGLWHGISSLKGNLGKNIVSFAKSVINFFKHPFTGIKNIGKSLVQGLWQGIKNAKNWVLSKIKGFGKSIVNGIKNVFGIHSPSRVMKEQVGKNIALGLIEGVNSQKSNVSKSATQLARLYVTTASKKVATLKKANKLTATQEVAFWNTIVSHTKKGTSSYSSALSKLNKSKENLKNSVVSKTNNFISEVKKLNETITNRKEEILNSLNLFSSVSLDATPTKGALKENLTSQVKTLKEWDKTLTTLKKKIKNKDLYSYLQSQGVSSLNTLKEFESMSTSELREYEKLYSEKEKIAQKRAEKENIGQLSSLRKSYLKNLKSLGVDASKTSKIVGKQIASGISKGFTQGMKGVTSTTKNQLRNLLKSIKKELRIKSPSQVFRDEVGKQIASGIGVGFASQMKNVAVDMKNAIPTNFSIAPKLNTSVKNDTLANSEYEKASTVNFNATVINNSKYTSPAENTRLLRRQFELQKLKYGRT